MDSENATLLLNTDDPPQPHADFIEQSSAGRSEDQQEHLCHRCAANDSGKLTLRLFLTCVAMFWCMIIFALDIGHMSIGRPTFVSVFVAIWADVTLSLLIILLYFGRRRYADHPLNRTVTQIKVLGALAISWLLLMAPIINTNVQTEDGERLWSYNHDCTRLFTAAHAFAWVLIVTLLLAAYATYRRAVKLHGTDEVAPPPPAKVSAWRLSGVADTQGLMGEGTPRI
ncbi:hypothetical protein R3P38DRAFT_3181263 [Favolaschia claudopus]|uniref:MARVEL domain-containing protein n=1 Tax=Favolaschia claudopus TaxID=2862362 RepID=A0AAW0CIB7_9AGAR